MNTTLITFIAACFYLFGYGIFIWGALRLINGKGLPKISITSLGIGAALFSIGLARFISSIDGGTPMVLGIIFALMAPISRHWEKGSQDWIEREGT
jgi:hypothetical protein